MRDIAKVKFNGWMFILLLASAPVLVSAITIITTDIPKYHPLLGGLAPPLNPWLTDLPVSIIPSTLLGILNWLMVIIPATNRFRSAHPLVRIALMGMLLILVLTILWVGIELAYLRIIFIVYHGPVIGFPVLASWVLILRLGWTCGVFVFAVLCVKNVW